MAFSCARETCEGISRIMFSVQPLQEYAFIFPSNFSFGSLTTDSTRRCDFNKKLKFSAYSIPHAVKFYIVI